MYVVRGEILFCEVYNFFTYLVVACNDNSGIRADQHVTHQNKIHATVAFILKIGGVNLVLSTLKSRNSVVASTVLVTVVPHTFSHAPMCLDRVCVLLAPNLCGISKS